MYLVGIPCDCQALSKDIELLMDSAELIEEDISEKAFQLRSDVGEYTEHAFKMYGGPVEVIVLEYDTKLIGTVYDCFGDATKITDVGAASA